MIRKNLLLGIMGVLMFTVFGFKLVNTPSKSTAIDMPEEVSSIIEGKCFGCHNTDSKNDKAKEKLDFKMLESLAKPDKVHALRDIGEVLEENEMPPKKYLDRFPDKALTKDEKKALMQWAKKEAKNAMK